MTPVASADIVVVGAGAAGCAAAAALATLRPKQDVWLIEAGPGGPHTPALSSPNYLRALSADGRSWPALRVRRTLEGPLVPYTQGRGLGGSTSINGGLLEIPDPVDATRLGWPELTGMAKAMVKPGAPLCGALASAESWGPLDHVLAEAGPGVLRDAAVVLPLLARRVQHRVDAASGFFSTRALGSASGTTWPLSIAMEALARDREPNLHVWPQTTVARVLFDGRRAAGVELADGAVIESRAVVLAAGTLATPAILLRSGVSDGVGTGLVDHASVTLTLSLRPEARSPSVDAAPTGVVIRSEDVALVPLGLTGSTASALATGAVLGILLASHGRGTVRLASPDPSVPLEVTFDALGDERDRAGLRGIVRSLADLARHPAVIAIAESATFGSDATPLDMAAADDATIDAWLVDHLADVFHAAGSCHDAVDHAGLLKDRDNCWVVDASVLPDLPRCAPALTVSALAYLLAAAIPLV